MINGCLLNIILVDRKVAPKYFTEMSSEEVQEYVQLLHYIALMPEAARKELLSGR